MSEKEETRNKNKNIQERFIATLLEKVGKKQVACQICGHDSWAIQDRYAVLPLSKKANAISLGKEAMPLIPMCCKNCGNTVFLNLLYLGFKEEELKSLEFMEKDIKEDA